MNSRHWKTWKDRLLPSDQHFPVSGAYNYNVCVQFGVQLPVLTQPTTAPPSLRVPVGHGMP